MSHQGTWSEYSNVTDSHDRQLCDNLAQTILETAVQKVCHNEDRHA